MQGYKENNLLKKHSFDTANLPFKQLFTSAVTVSIFGFVVGFYGSRFQSCAQQTLKIRE